MSESERTPLLKLARPKSSWRRFRESKQLVVAVVFVAMMLDLIVLTSIDPLLPNILITMDREHANESQLIVPANETQAQDNGTQNYYTTMENRTETFTFLNGSFPPGNLTDNSEGEKPEYTKRYEESVERRVGIIIALKPATEVIANIFVGAIVAKFGHMTPMMIGFVFNTASTMGFAYAPSFTFLIVARICQAVASSLSVISGLALVSCTFHDEGDRSKAISKAFGGLSLGIVLGYPFGSVTYQFVGRKVPFITLAALSLVDGGMRMLIAKPRSDNNGLCKSQEKTEKKPSAYLRLLRDPCIFSALLCNFAPNFALGVFLATGPAWMLTVLGAQQWQIGVVLAIAMLFQIVSQSMTGVYSTRFGRWRFCLMGMWIYSIGMLIYPHCTNVWMVTMAEILTRSGFGIIICVISPLLSHLVDIRHDSNYGEVFGLYTASYNIALAVGPLLGGFLLQYISFGTLYRSVSAMIFVMSWLCLVFRNPRPRGLFKDEDFTQGRCGDRRPSSFDEGFSGSIERSYMERGRTKWFIGNTM